MHCGSVKQTVALMLTPRYVASSMAGMPAAVAGIFTIMLGASPAKATAFSTIASVFRYGRGSICMESRPSRP